MQNYSSDEALKIYLDEISPLCFPLLRWTIQSNRTQLSFIPPKNQIKEMKTPLQLQVINSFQEHEKKFLEWTERAKKENSDSTGSYKAFHGSPITNWSALVSHWSILVDTSLQAFDHPYRPPLWIRAWHLHGAKLPRTED